MNETSFAMEDDLSLMNGISHQMKTPLAALNIYNGLLQDEPEDPEAVRELTALFEQELDRIEMLVQNLLKITKLDADAITFEMAQENVADMMKDVELSFAYRAKQEQKEIFLSGEDSISLCCDRNWMMEAIGNLLRMPWITQKVEILFRSNGNGFIFRQFLIPTKL